MTEMDKEPVMLCRVCREPMKRFVMASGRFVFFCQKQVCNRFGDLTTVGIRVAADKVPESK